MVNILGPTQYKVSMSSGKFIEITEQRSIPSSGSLRTLRLVCGDMFHTTDLDRADIVMLETDVPLHLQSKLCQLLSTLKENSRVLTYLELRKTWLPENSFPFQFQQLECNKPMSDRFPTSWSVQRGHHFFIWIKVCVCSSFTCVNLFHLLIHYSLLSYHVVGFKR